MSLRINDSAPDFAAETTQGNVRFHDWIGDGWAILFSHPKDFTPVCTTELGYMAGLQPEFEKRNCKIIGLSVDPVTQHGKWAKDIEETQGHKVNYPMIGDIDLKVAKAYGMLPAGTTVKVTTSSATASVGPATAPSLRARSLGQRALPPTLEFTPSVIESPSATTHPVSFDASTSMPLTKNHSSVILPTGIVMSAAKCPGGEM